MARPKLTVSPQAVKKTTKPRVAVHERDSSNEPKMTQAQSIAQAFAVLKNAGLLPVSIEAQPEANIVRISAQRNAVAEDLECKPMPDPVKSNKMLSPLTTIRPLGTVESSLQEQASTVARIDQEVSNLIDTLRPYLPQWVFEADSDIKPKEDCDFEWQPTTGTSLTPTQIAINSTNNELHKLRRRVVDLRNWIVI